MSKGKAVCGLVQPWPSWTLEQLDCWPLNQSLLQVGYGQAAFKPQISSYSSATKAHAPCLDPPRVLKSYQSYPLPRTWRDIHFLSPSRSFQVDGTMDRWVGNRRHGLSCHFWWILTLFLGLRPPEAVPDCSDLYCHVRWREYQLTPLGLLLCYPV